MTATHRRDDLDLVARANPVTEEDVAGLRASERARALRAGVPEGPATPAPGPARRGRRRRVAALALAALAVCGGGGAIAGVLMSEHDEARYLPNGAVMFIDTDPTCVTVRAGVEYRCTLARPPSREVLDDYAGTKEATVGDDRRVNGGCVGLSGDGMAWECYVGQAAVDRGIIGPGFLGQPVSGPGRG